MKVKPVGFANGLSVGCKRNTEIQDSIVVFELRNWNNEVRLTEARKKERSRWQGKSGNVVVGGGVCLRCLPVLSIHS